MNKAKYNHIKNATSTYRIALVATYRELAELTVQVSNELGISVTIQDGDLDEGLIVAKELISEGAEVIISRGGTATAIAKEVDVPVVAIAVSAFDLVRAVAKAKLSGQKIGVVGFRNIIYGSKTLESILDVSIEEIEIEDAEKVPEAISAFMKKGIDVIVGDAVSVRVCKKLGLPAILVDSGKEAIGIALREAQELASVRRRERIRTEQLRVILNTIYDGIIATDSEGRISLVNISAEKLLKIDGKRKVGKLVAEALPGYAIETVQENGIARLGDLHRSRNAQIVQNIVPVIIEKEIVGVVSTFQDVGHLERVETKVRQELYLKGHVAQFTFEDIVAQSQSMQDLLERSSRYAATEATILIMGETGTGKELLAQSIHNASRRSDKPFVAINCAAVPENLLESELFGYEEGAFTGARKGGKKGLFELAHKGTLFLDEVGELSLSLQVRLLRVLQERSIMRVGGDRLLPVDVRIIAATHRNLEEAIIKETFRRDLFYRLNVLQINLPPLRERLEDIPILIDTLIEKICYKNKCLTPVINDEILFILRSYSWPGNVRELENILERLVILYSGREIEVKHMKEIFRKNEVSDSLVLHLTLTGDMENMEKAIIHKTLELTDYDRDETCKRLGISKTTLWRRLKE